MKKEKYKSNTAENRQHDKNDPESLSWKPKPLGVTSPSD